MIMNDLNDYDVDDDDDDDDDDDYVRFVVTCDIDIPYSTSIRLRACKCKFASKKSFINLNSLTLELRSKFPFHLSFALPVSSILQ